VVPGRLPEEYQDTRRSDLDLVAFPPVTLQEAIPDLPEQAAGRVFGTFLIVLVNNEERPRLRRPDCAVHAPKNLLLG
jgi:hypothetical protein